MVYAYTYCEQYFIENVAQKQDHGGDQRGKALSNVKYVMPRSHSGEGATMISANIEE